MNRTPPPAQPDRRRVDDLESTPGGRVAAEDRRRHRRRTGRIKARIFRPSHDDGEQLDFSAWSNTFDLSVGGVFLESAFLLREGARVEVWMELSDVAMEVHVEGVVVNVIDDAKADRSGKPRGFAVKFTRYFGNSEIALRAFLTAGDMISFVEQYIEEIPKLSPRDTPQLVEMIVRWELHRESIPD